jgi:glycosyltransferase involved in cell wall biosynthesis
MPGAAQAHGDWLLSIIKYSESLISISKSVSDELSNWFKLNVSENFDSKLKWFHLGADVHNSVQTTGLPNDSQDVLRKLEANISFLMVGTVEPRKGHAQTLAAFEILWQEGYDINLVIVGKHGWLVEEIGNKIRHHKLLNKKLFWLQSISDEYLEKIYATSTCLIAASEGEGFGLPLIEAAQHHTPIIARDISVFKEVAGDSAFYFQNSNNPNILSNRIQEWIILYNKNIHPKSDNMHWITWRQSAEMILHNLGLDE